MITKLIINACNIMINIGKYQKIMILKKLRIAVKPFRLEVERPNTAKNKLYAYLHTTTRFYRVERWSFSNFSAVLRKIDDFSMESHVSIEMCAISFKMYTISIKYIFGKLQIDVKPYQT